ncbi:hypothetical protein PybrP1_012423 [[Pythium] brassicae (nom. inval.)]|nr:hypothetical protein PybrP1_012423 [[Pythium] brassicae (nom. inval.)]
MSIHIGKVDEPVLAIEMVGDAMDRARQIVILLWSLPSEYEMNVAVTEKYQSLNEVKEKLIKESEKLNKSGMTETTFKAKAHPKRHISARAKSSARSNAPAIVGV